ncbi:Integral membrane protein [Streptomyces ambofaciens ATCC 23877]|uniref:Integral membrane protein n=1 Tax=Streptomyces ambofaciens (strain ATCC 23877 / 3486 / DSM 40053 / JCM 4204 / NBRC 12836 / NRRL B-2516) TaxID=278992 RepID=A0A0K2ARW5_STRA7|nr:MAB_1171c family putative transporter [Streptomyces ambofaciens]AKZ55542.1 Integral membrane protein [Streptomyces ambofaciens ATCC 23877]
MNALINYVSCGALWLGLLVKAPDLLRHRHDPYLRALCAVLGLAGLCFLLGAPPTVGAVNRLSGVPNLAAPLTYAAITGYCAASQILVVHWRGGPRVRRTARRWTLAYALVVLGIAGTFALGDAPEERRTDLDTYYARTPFIAQMIVLYLVAHLTATGVTAVSALRWARRVRGGLRAGLTLLGIGSLCGAGYSVVKLVAVGARWSGHDWSALGTTVSPAAAGLGALMTVVGVLVPLLAPRVTEWRRARRAYARLEPLERALDDVLTRRALRLPRPRFASPATLLMWRRTSIHNALGHLDAYVDGDLYDRVHAGALAATDDPERAEAAAWAAVIGDAVRHEADPAGRDPVVRGTARPPGPAALDRIADALAAAAPVPAVPAVPSGTTTAGTA